MDRDGNRSRPSAQKGVLLVFTALLLPVVFACAGLAVDLGNMYVHKSNLQNAVDSAALAGAAGYIAGGETAEDHPGANIMSDEYLKANLGGEYQKLIVKDFQAQTVSGKTYYRVKVTQKSPVYFMTLLGLDPLTDVSADAVAQVGSAGSSSSGFGFKDLIVANHISDLGSIGPNYYYWWRDIFSPYLLGSYGIQATYDGNIVERGSDSPGYAFTPDAYNKTLGWAVADHNYFRLSDGGDTDYNSFYDSTERKFDDCCNEFWNVATYVSKGLLRGEILFAIDHMNEVLRHELLRMISWYVGTEKGFNFSLGKNYKFLDKHISKELWDNLLNTYSMSSYEEMWKSFDLCLCLFKKISKKVADSLGYNYPDYDENVTKYLETQKRISNKYLYGNRY